MTFLANCVSSQVSIEIVGSDTFPTITTWHGVTVSVFTDNQTTTLAHLVERTGFLEGQLITSDAVIKQQENVIWGQEATNVALQKKIDAVQLQLRLSQQNEEDLQTSITASIDKTKAEKKKVRIKLWTSIPVSILSGLAIGFGGGYVAAKK